MGQASDVARVAASIATKVPGHAPLHSFSLMPPVGSGAHMENLAPRQLPNKRLKLPGGYRSNGNGVFAPWRAQTVVHYSCASERVARSLSAIR